MTALASPRTNADEKTDVLTTAPAEPRERQRAERGPVRMAMYFSPDGALHHTRCRQPLQFRGVRAEVEGDFWCVACLEHVAVPAFAVSEIPVEAEEEDRASVLRLVR